MWDDSEMRDEHDKSSEPEPSRMKVLKKDSILLSLSCTGYDMYLQIAHAGMTMACAAQRALQIPSLCLVPISRRCTVTQCTVTRCRLQGYTRINGRRVTSSRLPRFFLFFSPFSATKEPCWLQWGSAARSRRLDANNWLYRQKCFTLLCSSFFIWTMGRDGVREGRQITDICCQLSEGGRDGGGGVQRESEGEAPLSHC